MSQSQDVKQQDQPINWLVVVVFGFFHIGAVAGRHWLWQWSFTGSQAVWASAWATTGS
jgi:hypothetical protein